MRLPIASDLVSRDGTLDKDAGTKNAIIEVEGEASAIRNRPGTIDLGSAGTGTAQLLACYNNSIKSIIGNTLADLSVSTDADNSHALPTTVAENWQSLAYGGGRFLAKNYDNETCAYSLDGLTWVQGADIGIVTDGSWINLAYGAGIFVAIPFLDSSFDYATSVDGTSWNIDAGGAPNDSILSFRFVNSLFVASVPDTLQAKIYTSANGSSWTLHIVSLAALPVNSLVHDVTYGNGKYAFHITDDTDHYISTTADLVSWTHTLVAYDNFESILFDSGNFIIPGRAYSSDGVSWSAASGLPAGLTENSSAASGGTCLSIFRDVSNDQFSYISTDGGLSWDLVSSLGNFVTSQEWGKTTASDGATPVFAAVSDNSDSAIVLYGPGFNSGDTIVTVDSSQAITSITPSLDFFAEVASQAASQNVIVFKNSKEAWTYDGTTLTKIADPDYPGWSVVTPTSITRSGSVATVTLPSSVNWQSDSTVTIAGADQTEYNGDVVIDVVDSTSFTYTVSGTPATPATGTITATGGRTTVPGIVFLDGYFFVMDEDAVVYGCELGDVTNWNALNFIAATTEPGSGIAITKSRNYVVALKAWSTEFLYDAGNATGSPLSPVISSFTLIGCASGNSVARINDSIVWMAKARQRGRSVYLMEGLEQKKVSTTSIDRILNSSDLSGVYSYGISISGHVLYALGLVDLNLTLVYDLTSNTWSQWTSLTAQSPLSCTITSANGVATVTCASHSQEDGNPVLIAGANESDYNGIKQISAIDANTFQFVVPTGTTTPATGTITATGYNETYFKYTKYVNCAGRDLLLHETNGHLFEASDAVYLDGAIPINMVARTGKVDGGNNTKKVNSRLEIIGNKNGGLAMVRHSDDDYETNSAFRFVDLESARPALRRLGSFRRRSFELRHVGDAPVQVASLELEIKQE